MKKLLISIATIFTITSCQTGVEEFDSDGDKVFVKVDSSVYRLVQVWYEGNRVVIMVPAESNVEIFTLPQTVNYQNGKINENLIIVK